MPQNIDLSEWNIPSEADYDGESEPYDGPPGDPSRYADCICRSRKDEAKSELREDDPPRADDE